MKSALEDAIITDEKDEKCSSWHVKSPRVAPLGLFYWVLLILVVGGMVGKKEGDLWNTFFFLKVDSTTLNATATLQLWHFHVAYIGVRYLRKTEKSTPRFEGCFLIPS